LSRRTCNWRLENEFLDGSVVIIPDAVLSQASEGAPQRVGEMRLYTHQRGSKYALARNEIADWFYEKID
jgi:hypothetical protein